MLHGLTGNQLGLLPNGKQRIVDQFRFGVLFAWIRRPFSPALTSFRFGVLFHLAMNPSAPYFVCFPSIFKFCKFDIAIARTPSKIEFLILRAAADGVLLNSLAKSGICSGISLTDPTKSRGFRRLSTFQ